MHISLETGNSAARIIVEGVVDESGAARLKKCLEGVDLSEVTEVIFDFLHLSYIGSSGVGKLLLFYKQAREKGIGVRIENLPPSVYELFMQLHLDALFPLVQREES